MKDEDPEAERRKTRYIIYAVIVAASLVVTAYDRGKMAGRREVRSPETHIEPEPRSLAAVRRDFDEWTGLLRSGIQAGYAVGSRGGNLTEYLADVDAEWAKVLEKRLAEERVRQLSANR